MLSELWLGQGWHLRACKNTTGQICVFHPGEMKEAKAERKYWCRPKILSDRH